MEAQVCSLYRYLWRLFPRSRYSPHHRPPFHCPRPIRRPACLHHRPVHGQTGVARPEPHRQAFQHGNPKRTLPWAIVVGVVPDVRIDAPDRPAGEQWYFPLEQPAIIKGSGVTGMVDLSSGWIALRSKLPPEQMIHSLRSVVAGIDPRLALDPVQPMADAISAVEAPRRFNTGLITAFALAALLLAAMGIYTVIAFSVSQRRQEIAVRMALGAQRGSIARLVLGSGAKIAAAGCALGLFGALAVSRLVRAFLFGVSATNPIVYTASVCLMLALALLASTLPALSAAAADPAHALRSE